ncbi:MAG: UDP-N-acetylmuramoyl-tripeptide--D-alanyl-D-alanine ligase, partial [Bacteroidales bacterium]
MISIDEIYHQFLQCPKIVTDSRQDVTEAIFIALKGEKFDGNRFAREAIQKGASLAIIDNPGYLLPGQCILVENTLQTLQNLARMHRRNNPAKIIGITGSNGKTTTKELIGAVLSSDFKTIVTQGNLNNHIGVPLTMLSIKKDTEFAVIEMGANHPGEIHTLCEIARPDYGIVTNIGKAHLEGFGSLEGVASAKTELYRFIQKNNGLLFVNKDNELLMKRSENISRITYGSSPGAACSGRIVNRHPAISLEWTWQNFHGFANTNLYGDYNFENILAAICIGMYLDVSPAGVSRALQAYVPENNRSQWLHTP